MFFFIAATATANQPGITPRLAVVCAETMEKHNDRGQTPAGGFV